MDTARTRVGAALRRWRQASGLTQVEAAGLARISQSAVSGAEHGAYSASLLLDLIALYRPPAEELAAEMLADEAAE